MRRVTISNSFQLLTNIVPFILRLAEKCFSPSLPVQPSCGRWKALFKSLAPSYTHSAFSWQFYGSSTDTWSKRHLNTYHPNGFYKEVFSKREVISRIEHSPRKAANIFHKGFLENAKEKNCFRVKIETKSRTEIFSSPKKEVSVIRRR